MNAVEFLERFGWNDARLCILNCASPQDRWLMRHGELISDQAFDDLERLVKSWELIAKFDGLEECKRIVSSAPSGAIGYHTMYEGYFDEKSKLYYEGLNQCLIVDLEQAIRDVESVGGGV